MPPQTLIDTLVQHRFERGQATYEVESRLPGYLLQKARCTGTGSRRRQVQRCHPVSIRKKWARSRATASRSTAIPSACRCPWRSRI
ncbi:hypothetical protein ACFS07_30885 [Undibacterium arcticum]